MNLARIRYTTSSSKCGCRRDNYPISNTIMKRILFALVLLTTLMLAGCSKTPTISLKATYLTDELEIGLEEPPTAELIIRESWGRLCIDYNYAWMSACSEKEIVPVLEISGDTLYVSDSTTCLCFDGAYHDLRYKIHHLPYGKYVLVYGIRNAEALQEFKKEFPGCEWFFPASEIDFRPNMQPTVIRERREKRLPETNCSNDSVAVCSVDTSTIIPVAEEMPEFPGGSKALCEYIVAHRMTPDTTPSYRRALVQFVVERDGNLSNIEVVRTCGNEELDNDAVSIVANMPKWKPGKMQGTPVRVRYTIPVTYRME